MQLTNPFCNWSCYVPVQVKDPFPYPLLSAAALFSPAGAVMAAMPRLPATPDVLGCCATSTTGAAGSLGRSHLTSLVAQDETASTPTMGCGTNSCWGPTVFFVGAQLLTALCCMVPEAGQNKVCAGSWATTRCTQGPHGCRTSHPLLHMRCLPVHDRLAPLHKLLAAPCLLCSCVSCPSVICSNPAHNSAFAKWLKLNA